MPSYENKCLKRLKYIASSATRRREVQDLSKSISWKCPLLALSLEPCVVQGKTGVELCQEQVSSSAWKVRVLGESGEWLCQEDKKDCCT